MPEACKQLTIHVIACQVMQAELETAAQGLEVVFHFLDQGLHRTPNRMPGLIQAEIDRIPPDEGPVILGYGLCSNGLVGVKAGPQGLVVPLAHDCLAFFMGSHAEYKRRFDMRPGTYYLTQGWLACGKDPLGCMREDYEPRLGPERAEWCMREEIKHYTHISLIDTTVGDLEALRKRTRENCAFFEKQYEEIPGSLDFFRKLLRGPHAPEEFLLLKPGQTVAQNMFL